MKINYLKRTILVMVTMSCISVNLRAQNYELTGKCHNGSVVSGNDVLYLNDRCVFSIVASEDQFSNIESFSWKVKIQKSDSTYAGFTNQVSTDKEYNIIIDKANFIDNSIFNTANRFNSENDNSIYFKVLVTCELTMNAGEKERLELPLFLNLLPSRPKVNILGTFFNERPPYIWIECIADRSDGLSSVYKEYDKQGGIVSSVTIPFPSNDDRNMLFLGNKDYYDKYDSEIGKEVVIFNSHNQFGSVSGDTLSSDDFGTSSIEVTGDTDLILYPNPAKDYIEIKNLIPDEIGSITVYDISGKLHRYILNPKQSRLDIYNLPKGLYSLIIEFSRMKDHKQFKFIKL
ncbi:T9SS type A sorting domain-containing protein [uncultured Dysgonomonas sp.]|uniref:T9SS type A sorting domain-containing protein n=1 Tax=uncultured Dysgonomonas sp. TaxID=206096 RepID=UPI002631D880|nr:T9SS type A sorting domain-containing protein [uncultured Dysgonomonas sp.]